MLISFLYHRFTGIQSRRSGRGDRLHLFFNESGFAANRRVFPIHFGFRLRVIHLTGFRQPSVQIFPFHFRTAVRSTATSRNFKRIIICIIMYLRRLGRYFLLKCRNVRHIFRIKVDGRDRTEFTQRLLHGCRKYLPDGLFILKLDFSLGRMDIHVNIGRIYIEIDKVGNLFTSGNQLFISLHNRLMKIRMTHITPVDKEILMCPFLTGSLRLGYVSGDFHHGSIDLYVQ